MHSIFGTHAGGLFLGLGALLAASACSRAPASDASPSSAPVATRQAAPELPPYLTSVAAQPPKASTSLVPCPAHIPEALNPPAEVTLALALPADGVQVYACSSAKAGEAPAWSLEGPHALLRSASGVSGIHLRAPHGKGSTAAR